VEPSASSLEASVAVVNSSHAHEMATSLRAYLSLPTPKCACDSVSARERFHSNPRRSLPFRAHLRRIAIVVLSAVSRTYLPFVLMGVLNRAFPTFVSVFFCYAGDTRYATHYSYPVCRPFLLWFPSVIGVFRQGRRWGLICAAPVTEAEFTDPKNARSLGQLLHRMLRIKMLLRVERLSFAGILPNVLRGRYPQSISNEERDRTPEVVRRAVHEVRKKHFAKKDHKVVLLGGAGRIGRAVYGCLKADNIDLAVIDSAVTTAPTFKDLGPASLILVDVSRPGVIQRYIQELPAGTVVLNEVFPEPSRDVVKQLKDRNIVAYHIAGVKAEVYPSLPHGYRNAVPCCAIHSDEIGELVLTRIA
jgi:hypothetical protein